MQKIQLNKKGFTLVEILVAIGGAAAVGLTIATLATRLQSNQVQSQVNTDLLSLVNKIQANLSNKKILIATVGMNGTPSELTGGNKILNDCIYVGCAAANYSGAGNSFAIYQNPNPTPTGYDPSKNVKLFGSSTSSTTYLDDAGNSCTLGAAGCRWILDFSFKPVNSTNEVPFDVVNPSGTVATQIHIDATIKSISGVIPGGLRVAPKTFSLDVSRSSIVQLSQAKTSTVCIAGQKFNGYDSSGNAICTSVPISCGTCEAFMGYYPADGSVICQCVTQIGGSKSCSNPVSNLPMIADYSSKTYNGSFKCADFNPNLPAQDLINQCQNLQWGQGGSCFFSALNTALGATVLASFSINPADWANAVNAQIQAAAIAAQALIDTAAAAAAAVVGAVNTVVSVLTGGK